MIYQIHIDTSLDPALTDAKVVQRSGHGQAGMGLGWFPGGEC